jgi:alpha-D-ribose 1-methylphosphonate 5-triphosphate synthase subunit PhnH
LLDLETSYYTNHAALARMLAQSGARPQAPHLAHYQFYPELTDAALRELSTAPIGTYADPDTSTTLVLGCAVGVGQRLRLSGPGIAAPSLLALSGLPPALWDLRAAACRYPLGWDIFFVAGDQLVGLPRSTHVEVL